ncbi:MAG: hypothetical protein IPK93_10530 [Solirubrobacterales bacterium]|nr:hypothetical protein [Solirubrobacterales bacterium]
MKSRVTLIAVLMTCFGFGSVSVAGAGFDPNPGADANTSAKKSKKKTSKKKKSKKRKKKSTTRTYDLSGSLDGQPGSTVSMKVKIKKVAGKKGFTTKFVKNVNFDGIAEECGRYDPGISSYKGKGMAPTGKNQFATYPRLLFARWAIVLKVKKSGKKVVGTYSSRDDSKRGCKVDPTKFTATA